MALTITSPEFSHGSEIPVQFTCDGLDESPPLNWSGVPQDAKGLTLIVSDPDAPDPEDPKMTWVHWVLYNLPPTSIGLAQGVGNHDFPSGTMEGVNDWRLTGYGGPCPPIGRHRYYFKLYALDVELPDQRKPTKAQLEKAMEGHILEEAELMGTYQR